MIRGKATAKVRPIVNELLRDNDELTEEEIYDLTREKLGEQGVSAQGLALRVREALATADIAETRSGVFTLKRPTTPSAQQRRVQPEPSASQPSQSRPTGAVLRPVATR